MATNYMLINDDRKTHSFSETQFIELNLKPFASIPFKSTDLEIRQIEVYMYDYVGWTYFVVMLQGQDQLYLYVF